MGQLGKNIPGREKDMDTGVEQQTMVCVGRVESSRWGAGQDEAGQVGRSQPRESLAGSATARGQHPTGGGSRL